MKQRSEKRVRKLRQRFFFLAKIQVFFMKKMLIGKKRTANDRRVWCVLHCMTKKTCVAVKHPGGNIWLEFMLWRWWERLILTFHFITEAQLKFCRVSKVIFIGKETLITWQLIRIPMAPPSGGFLVCVMHTWAIKLILILILIFFNQ